jgi:protein TonB
MRLFLAIAIYILAIGCKAENIQSQQPVFITAPKPVYLPASIRFEEEGTVVVRVLFNENGEVDGIGVHKSSGFSRLDESALAAVAKAKIRPYSLKARTVRTYFLIPIAFKLDPPESSSNSSGEMR